MSKAVAPRSHEDARALAEAIRGGAIHPLFQPKIALPSGELAGVEALARWRGRDIGPSDFVPLAESAGLIDALSERMIDAALAQAAEWALGGLSVNLALNISPLNLNSMSFPDRVLASCARHGVSPGCVTIELTESAAQQAIRLMDTLTRFRLNGVGVSLDDFGTGFSSLVQLQQLPFTELKIDRCFVADAHRSRDSRIIVKSIIDLAHNLEMEVTAEGVECPQVLDLLVELGCDRAQGHLIAEPMSGALLPGWLAKRPPLRLDRNAA